MSPTTLSHLKLAGLIAVIIAILIVVIFVVVMLTKKDDSGIKLFAGHSDEEDLFPDLDEINDGLA